MKRKELTGPLLQLLIVYCSSGLFAYTVGKRQRNRIMFGYRYKQTEFKDGNLITDYTYSGPLAGFNFLF